MRPLLALTLSLSAATLTFACIHPPKTFEGSVEQTGQSAIAFWDGGVQDLVIKPAFRAKGAKAPASLAWVIPVPSVPTSYAETKGAAFKDLHDAWEANKPQMRSARGSKSKGMPSDEGGIQLLKPAVAGDYAIQPIKTVGAAGGKALNAWLTSNGFSPVPSENMAYYVERKWVWLCVKAQTNSAKGELKPLRITFKTPKVVYPLKFSTHQGTFALTLWVITKKELSDVDAVRKATRLGISRMAFELPASVASAAKGVKPEGRMTITRVSHGGLSGKAIEGWAEDLSFTPSK